jgi:hypothetical protein
VVPRVLATRNPSTYFKLKPLDLSLVPGLTQYFAAFRTYKERIPVILREPSASTRIFLRIIDMERLLAEHIQVLILGYAGWILRSYLHDLYDHDIQAFIVMTKLKNDELCCKPCLSVSMPKNHRVVFSTSRKSLPMVVQLWYHLG